MLLFSSLAVVMPKAEASSQATIYNVGLIYDNTHDYSDIYNLLKTSNYINTIIPINLDNNIINNSSLKLSGLDAIIIIWDTANPNALKLNYLEKNKNAIANWVYNGGIFICEDQTGSYVPIQVTYSSLFSNSIQVSGRADNAILTINAKYADYIGTIPNSISSSDLTGSFKWNYWDHYTTEINNGYFTSWSSDWKPLLYDGNYPTLLVKEYGSGFYFPSTMFFRGSGLLKVLENMIVGAKWGYPIMNLADKYDQLLTNYKTLNDTNRSISSSYDSLNSRYQGLQSNMSVLRADTVNLQSQIVALRSNSTSLQSQVNGLKNDKNGMQSQISSLQSDKTALQSQVGSDSVIQMGLVGIVVLLLILTVYFYTKRRTHITTERKSE